MKRIATISAILLIVPCIIAANGDVARPRIQTKPSFETVRLSGMPGETASPETQEALVVKTIKISDNRAGNKRYPGVCENAQGDRLVIYRGPNILYWYSFARKDASWSAPAIIPKQPAMKSCTCTDVEADSTGRFHCLWEDLDRALFYASFLDGKWTTPIKVNVPGKHDMGGSIAVRSNDEVVVVDADFVRSPNNSKEIYLYFKGKTDSHFKYKNITNDRESSTTPAVAVDANDHIWVALKSDLNLHSTDLITSMYHFDEDNDLVSSRTLSVEGGWNFWPQIAVNSEGKVMASWVLAQSADYFSRLYNPQTRNWSSIVKVNLGIPNKPWCAFWSKLAAHGKDFYLAAMNSGRYLRLLKFNEKTRRWANVATVSDDPVYYFDLYSGNDKMLIAWDNANDPSNVYLTTVDVPPLGPPLGPPTSKISGVANLKVEKRVERGFFHGYILNALTWEANPENTEMGLVISAQRVYRKARTEDNSKWARIAELAGSILKYEDRNVPSDSDYVYAVTCVDDKGNESAIY